MEELTIDVLLEFLYDRFAVTFILCLLGSFIREAMRSSKRKNKDKRSKMLDIKRIVTSTVFSTFLMCACADYVDLQFSVYALISIFCGIWGIVITDIFASENFIVKFILNLAKKIANPLIKSAVESASETLKEQQKKSDTETKDKNK